MKNNTTIVCVDVDETLIKGQGQRHFLKFLRKKNIISFLYYSKVLLWFALYKLDLVHDPKPIMNYAYAVIKGKTRDEVYALIDEFFESELKFFLIPEVVTAVKKEQALGGRVLLISNSADILVRKIAEYLETADYLATKLSIQNQIYDGTIVPPIMYGESKVRALELFLDEKNLTEAHIITYTDHISDLPLLERADEKHVVNPKKRLKLIAKQKGWDIIDTE